MRFIGTEDNSLAHAASLLQVLRDFVRYLANAVFDDDIVVVVGIVVDAVFDRVSVDVLLPFEGSPFISDVGLDVDDLEGSKEAVIYAFPEAIFIDGIAKIGDVRLVARFLWCCRHTYLYGIRKVLKNLSPIAIVFCASPVALVHDDEVEEFGLEEFFVVLRPFLSDELLIEREIDLVSRIGVLFVLLIIDLVDSIREWLKVLLYRLVHQDVSVGQIEHFLHLLGLEQTIDDLEGSIGFAGSCRHNKEQTLLSLGNSLNRTVYCIPLVIARWKSVLTSIIRLVDGLQLVWRDAFSIVTLGKETGIEFLFRGKLFHRNSPFLPSQEIILLKAEPVGTVGKGNVHHPSILLRLLHTEADRMVGILRLDNCNRRGAIEEEHVVGFLGFLADKKIALQVYLAIGNLRLHRNLVQSPTFTRNGRRNIS